MPEKTAPELLEEVIKARKTEKVLGELGTASSLSQAASAACREVVLDAIKTAGWAPFHYPRNVDKLAEPWRAHVLWREQAKRVAAHLRDGMGLTSKEPALCAGCDALVLVTWLPEFYDAEVQRASKLDRAKQIDRDEEHLAAAAAMVQNLLLLLTAHGMGTYWSSGGKLRGPEVFDYLGIPTHERLLAAVFVEFAGTDDTTKQRVPGKLRDMRSEGWVREVSLG